MQTQHLRILVITNLFPDRKQPTFGTFMAAHVEALQRAGAVVQVAKIRSVAVHRKIVQKYARLFLTAAHRVGSQLFRGTPPHVVEAHIAYPTGVIAWPLARIARAKLVLYCHGADLMEVGRRSGAHHRLARFTLRRADLLVANSQFTRTLLLTQYGVSASRIVVWSPGIDTDLFHERRDLQRHANRVLYVGRLDGQKGVHHLIDAMDRLSDQTLTIRLVGSGPDRAMLEAAAGERHLSAEFVGALAPVDVAREMAEAGVLVVPSAHGESLGLVALEGMAAGALVVASATGGLMESVDDGTTGWLVPPGDVDALAQRLRTAVDAARAPHASATRRMREAAQLRAAEHDIYRIARESVAEYRRLSGMA